MDSLKENSKDVGRVPTTVVHLDLMKAPLMVLSSERNLDLLMGAPMERNSDNCLALQKGVRLV